MGRHISDEEFRELFESGRPVRISEIGPQLATSRATVTRLLVRYRACTSVNAGGLHCVLPDMCRFDADGFCRIGRFLFFRHGNQREAICHYVSSSEAGRRVAEVNRFLGVGTAMQLLRLTREGRLQRQELDGTFVYFAGEESRGSEQRQCRLRAKHDASARLTVAEMLVREDRESLELLVKVLLTCLAHPGFSAKSVALSLARRGESVCTAWVRGMFERFDVVKRGSRS